MNRHTFTNSNDELIKAVNVWCNKNDNGFVPYSSISYWDVILNDSDVTLNNDIIIWEVGNVSPIMIKKAKINPK